jgi:hypothetical protein
MRTKYKTSGKIMMEKDFVQSFDFQTEDTITVERLVD